MGVEGVPFFDVDPVPRMGAHLYQPVGVDFGPDGAPYVLDYANHRIRTVAADDVVRTVVGVGVIGDGIYDPITDTWSGGPGLDYHLNHPSRMAFDAGQPGWMYIAALQNSRVVRYSFLTLEVEYFAGNGTRSFAGDGGAAIDGAFDLVSSVAFDDDGNLYVTDMNNEAIRRIDPAGVLTTVAGVVGVAGCNGDDFPATETWLNVASVGYAEPTGASVWFDGALWLADTNNHMIRRFDPAAGTVERVAGQYIEGGTHDWDYDGVIDPYAAPGFGGDGGPATDARLNMPRDLAIASDGTMYIADTGNDCIRVVAPDGTIDTFAGVCTESGLAVVGEPSPAEGLPAREGRLSRPFGVAVDAAGNVYISDTWNHVIRVVWAPTP
jgi:hypothetical protein